MENENGKWESGRWKTLKHGIVRWSDPELYLKKFCWSFSALCNNSFFSSGREEWVISVS
jgi:hypothetical protein